MLQTKKKSSKGIRRVENLSCVVLQFKIAENLQNVTQTFIF